MRESGVYWAVQVTRRNGSTFLASCELGPCGHVAYRTRARASEFADELAKAISVPRSRLKAVKVRVTIEEA